MPAKKSVRKPCKQCGKVRKLSKHHLCKACATDNIYSNARQLKLREGHFFERWKTGIINYAMNKSEEVIDER